MNWPRLLACCLAALGLLWGSGAARAEQFVEFTVHSRVGALTQVSVAGIEGQTGAYVAVSPQGERYPISQEGIEIEGVTYTIPRVQAPRQGGRTVEYAKLASDGEQASLSVDNVRTMVEVGSDWYQAEQDLCAAGAPPPLAPVSCSQGDIPWSWQSYDKKLQVAGGELSLVFYVGYYTGPAVGYQPAYVVVRGADPTDRLDNLGVAVVNAQFRLVGDLLVGLDGWNPRDLGILRFDPRLVGPGLLAPETIPAQANTSAYSRQEDGGLDQLGSSQEFERWTAPVSEEPPETGPSYSTSDLAGTWNCTVGGDLSGTVTYNFNQAGTWVALSGSFFCPLYWVNGSLQVAADGTISGGNSKGYHSCQSDKEAVNSASMLGKFSGANSFNARGVVNWAWTDGSNSGVLNLSVACNRR